MDLGTLINHRTSIKKIAKDNQTMMPFVTYFVVLLLLFQVSNADDSISDAEQLIAKLKKQNEELIKENAKLKQLYTSCSQRVNSSQRKKEAADKQVAAYEMQIAEQKEEIQKCSVEKFNFQAEITSLKEQLAAVADQIANQGAARVDPFLEGAKIEHEQFGSRIISESERQRNLLLEEAEEVGNGPKDIALFCASSPQIRISDLDRDLVRKNICLQLQLGSPELQTRLLLYCDGIVNFESYSVF